LEGRYCRLEPLDPVRHAAELYEAISLDSDGRDWTYLPYGPFASLTEYRKWMESVCESSDPGFFGGERLFFAIVDNLAGKPLGRLD
jgi:hypothetical protein